jgi:hypothetical protein
VLAQLEANRILLESQEQHGKSDPVKRRKKTRNTKER